MRTFFRIAIVMCAFMGGAALSAAQAPIHSSYIYHQYTYDGSALQQIAVYSDGYVATNLTGPRKGVQFVIANTEAVIDMCHTYKKCNDYMLHKYSWGTIRTYDDFQRITYK